MKNVQPEKQFFYVPSQPSRQGEQNSSPCVSPCEWLARRRSKENRIIRVIHYKRGSVETPLSVSL